MKKDVKKFEVAKQTVADERCEKLETLEGQKKLFSTVKICLKVSKDFTRIHQVKERKGTVFRKEVDIRQIWHGYFKKLLNNKHPKKDRRKGSPNTNVM